MSQSSQQSSQQDDIFVQILSKPSTHFKMGLGYKRILHLTPSRARMFDIPSQKYTKQCLWRIIEVPSTLTCKMQHLGTETEKIRDGLVVICPDTELPVVGPIFGNNTILAKHFPTYLGTFAEWDYTSRPVLIRPKVV